MCIDDLSQQRVRKCCLSKTCNCTSECRNSITTLSKKQHQCKPCRRSTSACNFSTIRSDSCEWDSLYKHQSLKLTSTKLRTPRQHFSTH